MTYWHINYVAIWKGVTQGVIPGVGLPGLFWELMTMVVNLPILGWTDDYAAHKG